MRVCECVPVVRVILRIFSRFDIETVRPTTVGTADSHKLRAHVQETMHRSFELGQGKSLEIVLPCGCGESMPGDLSHWAAKSVFAKFTQASALARSQMPRVHDMTSCPLKIQHISIIITAHICVCVYTCWYAHDRRTQAV